MKTFPYSLVRLSGLPWSFLQVDLGDFEKNLDLLLEARSEFDTKKNSLLQALEKFHRTTKDYRFKAKLTTRLARLSKNKSAKSLQALTEHISLEDFNGIQKRQNAYADAKEALDNAQQTFELFFNSWISEKRDELLTRFAKSKVWQDLAFVHPNLPLRAYNLIAQEGSLNKKSRQTWRTLLKIATRSATKTSPFAHFGPVAWVGIDQEGSVDWQLNQWLHKLLREALLGSQEYQIKYSLNPSLVEEDNYLLFVQEKNGVESLHRLQKQEIFEMLLRLLQEQSLSRDELIDQLIELTGLHEKELSTLLSQLIELNFLVVDWHVQGNDTHWVSNWLPHLPERFYQSLYEIDNLLKTAAKDLASISLRELQEQVKQKMAVCFPGHLMEDLPHQQRLVFSNVFKKSVPQMPTWADQFAESTHYLQRILDYVLLNPDRSSLLQCYNAFPEQSEVPLMKLHEQFHRLKPFDLTKETNESQARQRDLLDYLKANAENGESLIFSQKSLLNFILSRNVPESHWWRGVMIQSNGAQHYLGHTFLGHGKMISRFLGSSGREIQQAILAKNNSSNERIIEPISENYFTANLHPPLTDSCLDWQETSNKDNLSLAHCTVKKDKAGLSLMDRKSGKKLCPIDYGFQALELRSPLYQTIVALGPTLNNIDSIRPLLRSHFTRQSINGLCWPRITLDNGLVLLRKGWQIELKDRLFIQDRSEAESWLQIRKWQSYLGLPDQVFFSLKVNSTNRSSDEHKPQYFDFRNPVLLPLLKSIVKNQDGWLMIEEAYPIPKKSNDPHSAFAQEWVIEYLDRQG